MYLLDTPIVFELRKAKHGQTDPGLAAWASSVARQNFYISAVTLLELETRISQAERRDKSASLGLRAWLDDQVMNAFDGHILAVDAAVVRRRGALALTDPRDALIAATALTHGLTLVTRDVARFKAARVKLFNPWGYAPEAADADDDASDWRQAAKAGPLWLKNMFLRF